MKLIRNLRRDDRGASAVEFALAVPVLIVFVYGIFMVGLIFQANAGLQHALGEAARHATLYPTPSDTAIAAKITAKKFGLQGGTLNTPTIDNANIGDGYKTISLTYSRPTNFLLIPGPTVSITRSKRVYVAT
jgi:Flp pilus assembly protein TadG